MTLTQILASYLSQHDYGVSPGHAANLRYSLQSWRTFLGRPPALSDLTDEHFNVYIDWLRERRKPDTVRTRRGNLLILWHWAFTEGLVEMAPRRIRKLRPICRTPQAWTVEEVRTLIAAAEELPGCFHRTRWRKSAWMGSLIRTAYDTGLRLADLLAIQVDTINCMMVIVQHKTGRSVAVQVRPATLAAIDQTLADDPRELIWPLWCGRQTFYEHIKRLVSEAGIRPGTFKWLRRSAVTAVESVQPGAGTRLAGHTSRSTTETWYIDQSQLSLPPLPPL